MTALARVPPHDLDAEMAVLSAVLLPDTSSAALAQVGDIVTPAAFYAPAHRLIFQAAQALAEAAQPVDAVTVAAWLKSRERLAEVGGTPHLARITDAAPSVTNLEAYARVVRDKARMRTMIATCQRLAAEAYADVGDEQVFLEQAEAEIGALVQVAGALADTEELLGECLVRLFKHASEGKPLMGLRIPLGLPALDGKLEVGPGDLVIVAGRPGMGKSALAMGLAVEVAKMGYLPEDGPEVYVRATQQEIFAALILSAEMPREQVALRAVCAESQAATVSDLRTARTLGEGAWGKLAEATKKLRHLPVWVDDKAAPRVSYVRAKIRERKAALASEAKRAIANGERPVVLRLVVVDYLQIMGIDRRGAGKDRNREQEISETTRELKRLAKEEGVVIVLLSQLSRRCEERPNKRPTLGDLRESGAIEQDADAVVFVYRHGYYDKSYKHQHAVELLVEKQRNGATGRALAAFRGAFTLFEELSENEAAQLAQEEADGPPVVPRKGKGKMFPEERYRK